MTYRGPRLLGTSLALAALLAGSCTAVGERPVGGGRPTERAPRGSPAPSASPEEPGATGARGHPERVALGLAPVASGFAAPLLVTSSGDGSRTLFVVEQGGRIWVLSPGGGRRLFLDVSALVRAGGEQGLLGLAFHPGYGGNGLFYIDYTNLDGDTVVAEYHAGGRRNRAAPSSARTVITIDQPFPNHNGGAIAFGPDGMLYVALGDGGSEGDPMDNGQSLDTLLGKLLRIDVDSPPPGSGYAIPRDNPFRARAGARPEIWAYGLRNPWRFSFDRATGDLWIGDVGQSSFEEIDRARAGSPGGVNYGWRLMEARACYEPSSGCGGGGLVLPVTQYSHSEGCAVTGGYVYRGAAFPVLRGTYLFADYCSGTIWGIDAAGGDDQTPVRLLSTGHLISSFGEDAGGELYVTDIGSGEILRITAARSS